jgi:STE24 endopeptidase
MIRRLPLLFFAVTLCATLARAIPQSPAPSNAPSAQAQSPSPTQASTLSGESHAHISAYTLPPEVERKAHRLGTTRFITHLFAFFYGLFVLWLVLQQRWAAGFRDWAEKFSRFRFVQAALFTALLTFTVAVLELPVDVFQEWISKRYGISVQTWPSWTGDWFKEQFLTIILGSLLVWLLYAVIRKSPRRWWLYFWAMSLPILLFVVVISPVVIDPLFNTYEPLASKAPQLIPGLQRVVARAGQTIPPERMFWMKASDKTIGTNASVNGFGPSKRIIIWDTTLAQESTDEILTDFGHEMGHYVLNHIAKGLLFAAGLLLVLLYLGFRTIGWVLARYAAAWSIRGLDDWASFPVLLLLISVFGIVAGTLANSFSRYLENQADVYSLEVTHGIVADPGQACARSFQKYGETVFVDPRPNPLNVFLFYDHPTVAGRIHLCATYDPWSKGELPQFVK